MIAIIIATKNRSEDLRKYALESLFRQDYKDFIVIICDASSDNKSELVCKEFSNKLNLVYLKAKRLGAASQRNDAIQYMIDHFQSVTKVFFMDDDSEFSDDAISGVLDTFKENGNLKGVYIPRTKVENKKKNSIYNCLWKVFRYIFLMFDYKSMHTSKYLYVYFKTPGVNNEKINWICSSGAAYDISVFKEEKRRFNEDFQRFGGYALGEDIEFSLSISNFKEVFLTSIRGFHNHWPAKGGRLDLRNYFAAYTYNYKLMFSKLHEGSPKIIKWIYWGLFNWTLFGNILIFTIKNPNISTIKEIYFGIRDAKHALKEDYCIFTD